MPKTIEEIADTVMSALYAFVTKAAGDLDETTTADDPFISWCQPGIPFTPEDFRFAEKMLIGQGVTSEERASDALLQFTQAAAFSRFVDFVPTVDGIAAGKVENGVLRPGRAALSDVYKKILDASEVAQLPQPEGINERIAALQAQAKPLQQAYEDAELAYLEGRANYVAARMAAAVSATSALEFQAKGPILRKKADRARQAWEIDGNKTQYENLLGEIASLRAKRSPAIWRSEALERYDDLPEGQNATFGEARITLPYPGSFASSTSGWMDFGCEVSASSSSTTTKSRKWGAEGGFKWGSLKLGASGGGSTGQTLSVKDTSGFGIKMKIAKVPLMRSQWFDASLLRCPYWRFSPTSVEGDQGSVVSDGSMPPQGLLVAYPIEAIFVREVAITFAELKDENSQLVKTLKAQGGGGWGFGVITAAGSYEHGDTTVTQKTEIANGWLKIEGLSLIGFVNELLARPGQMLPGPKEDLEWVRSDAPATPSTPTPIPVT